MILLGQIISQPMQAPIQIRGMAVQTTKWLQPPVQYILHQQLRLIGLTLKHRRSFLEAPFWIL